MSLTMTLGEQQSSKDDDGEGGAQISRRQYLPLLSTTERMSSERSGGSWSDGRGAAGGIASGDGDSDDRSSCC
jgi:hypothetical protein